MEASGQFHRLVFSPSIHARACVYVRGSQEFSEKSEISCP